MTFLSVLHLFFLISICLIDHSGGFVARVSVLDWVCVCLLVLAQVELYTKSIKIAAAAIDAQQKEFIVGTCYPGIRLMCLGRIAAWYASARHHQILSRCRPYSDVTKLFLKLWYISKSHTCTTHKICISSRSSRSATFSLWNCTLLLFKWYPLVMQAKVQYWT